MPVVDTNSTLWNPFADYIGDAVTIVQDHHLSIQDSDLLTHVPIGGVLGWDDDYLQSGMTCYAPLSFDFISAFATADFETEELIARRLSTIIATAVFTNSGASTIVHMFVKDKSGIFTMMSTDTLTATNVQDENNYYLTQSKEYKTFGADKVKFLVEAPSAGDVSFRMAVI